MRGNGRTYDDQGHVPRSVTSGAARSGAHTPVVRIGLVGAGPLGHARAAALAGLALAGLEGAQLVGVFDENSDRSAAAARRWNVQPHASLRSLLSDVNAVCIATATAERFAIAHAAVAQGVHVFLEWPPTTSADETERLGQRAEEAGVEVGLAQPLSTAPLLKALPSDWRPRFATIALTTGAHAGTDAVSGLPWTRRLAGITSLCLCLAQSSDVQRADAEADRSGGPHRALAFSLRFRNGVYTQAVLRDAAHPVSHLERFRLEAVGGSHTLRAHALAGPLCVVPADRESSPLDMHASLAPIRPQSLELEAFLEAIQQGRSSLFSLIDGLHTLRLVERLLERLR